jgi:hypothetical protein
MVSCIFDFLVHRLFYEMKSFFFEYWIGPIWEGTSHMEKLIGKKEDSYWSFRQPIAAQDMH